VSCAFAGNSAVGSIGFRGARGRRVWRCWWRADSATCARSRAGPTGGAKREPGVSRCGERAQRWAVSARDDRPRAASGGAP
jgi:hypothetical protein